MTLSGFQSRAQRPLKNNSEPSTRIQFANLRHYPAAKRLEGDGSMWPRPETRVNGVSLIAGGKALMVADGRAESPRLAMSGGQKAVFCTISNEVQTSTGARFAKISAL
jgi:hypothetical protein